MAVCQLKNKKNIIRVLQTSAAYFASTLDTTEQSLKSTTLDEQANAQTHLLSDYAPNITEETLECMA
jgi:hypothetical protein